MQKAVVALGEYEAARAGEKRENERIKAQERKGSKKLSLADEFDQESKVPSNVWLVVGMSKMVEETSNRPVRIAIPHPMMTEAHSVCLITKDTQRKYKDLVKPLKIKPIKKIIGLSKLRTKFSPFEAKRNLCNSFDLFLADSRVLPYLPRMLGKSFFEKKKHPAVVDIRSTEDNPEMLAEELQSAISATYLHLTGGACTSIRVGTLGQTAEQIGENTVAVVKGLEAKLPGGLSVIRTLFLKTSASTSLPIFERTKAGQDDEQEQ